MMTKLDDAKNTYCEILGMTPSWIGEISEHRLRNPNHARAVQEYAALVKTSVEVVPHHIRVLPLPLLEAEISEATRIQTSPLQPVLA